MLLQRYKKNTNKTFLPCWNSQFSAFHIKRLLLSLDFVNLLAIILQIVLNIYCSNNTFASFFYRYWPCNSYFAASLKTTFCRFLCHSQPHQYPYCFCDKHNHIPIAFVLAFLLVYIMPLCISSKLDCVILETLNILQAKLLYIMCGTMN